MLRWVLPLAVALLVAAPVAAQGFDAPQLFWRPYIPGAQGGWQPLQGAVVNAFQPEIGILVGRDPAGKDPGSSLTVTKVPDNGTPSDALSYPGLCFTMPGFADKIDPLYQLKFRGFGTYTIHAVSLTNAQAMTSTACNLSAGLANDTTFTVRAVPTLELVLKSAALDNDSNLNLVAVARSPAGFGSFPADYVCARNAHAGADGTPAGANRVTVAKATALEVPRLRRTGRWSCAARYEALSEGSQQTFTGPWGPIFNFDVTDRFRLDSLRMVPLGGTRYTYKGAALNPASPGAKVRVTFTKGRGCPAARKVSKTMTIGASGRFSTTVNLPEHGNRGYVLYGWRVRFEFLGTRFLREFRLDDAVALSVRSSGGQPRYRKPQLGFIDDASRAGCVRQPILRLPSRRELIDKAADALMYRDKRVGQTVLAA